MKAYLLVLSGFCFGGVLANINPGAKSVFVAVFCLFIGILVLILGLKKD